MVYVVYAGFEGVCRLYVCCVCCRYFNAMSIIIINDAESKQYYLLGYLGLPPQTLSLFLGQKAYNSQNLFIQYNNC